MNRRDLLKRAAIIPAAGFGLLLGSSTPAAAGFSLGTMEGVLVNIYPGGGLAPESQNGGDIVIKIRTPDQLIRTALVDKKTAIFISGGKVRYRDLLEEVYTNQQTLLHNLQNADVTVVFRTGLKAKKIFITFD